MKCAPKENGYNVDRLDRDALVGSGRAICVYFDLQ